LAKHEIKASLSDVLSTGERLLKASGRLVVIYPADRTADVITQMRAFRLEAKGLRFVHSREDSDAELVLAEGIKHGNPGLKVSPPLVVARTDGGYTDEVRAMIGANPEP
jgi:tRNA1(Val) A37 N6-methylase TrmN6